MKSNITVNIVLDTTSRKVTDMDIVEGSFHRIEFVLEGVDDPLTIREAINYIQLELEDMARVK